MISTQRTAEIIICVDLVILILGVALGFLLAGQLTSKPDKSIKPPESKIARVEEFNPVNPPPPPKDKPAQPPAEPRIGIASPQRKQATPAGRQVTLTSSIIREMEDNWNGLRYQIRLTRESDGWRIQDLEMNSSFARAGFLKGDLITQRAIDSIIAESPEDGDLPDRFRHILKYVSD